MNFSAELWEDPEKFSPERFITSEGRILKPEYFLPFSTGRRQCIGYKMAMDTCKVIVANLCLNFEISLDSSTNYDMERGILAVGKGKICPFIYTPIEE
jgi:cytochrome P450 family 307 subfamily A